MYKWKHCLGLFSLWWMGQGAWYECVNIWTLCCTSSSSVTVHCKHFGRATLQSVYHWLSLIPQCAWGGNRQHCCQALKADNMQIVYSVFFFFASLVVGFMRVKFIVPGGRFPSWWQPPDLLFGTLFILSEVSVFYLFIFSFKVDVIFQGNSRTFCASNWTRNINITEDYILAIIPNLKKKLNWKYRNRIFS